MTDLNLEIQKHYKKVKENINNYGHSINGCIDGKGHLERPFVHTIGASFKLGYEFFTFFPVKGKGLDVASKTLNSIIASIKEKKISIVSQIINDKNIYYLPLVMYVLNDTEKETIESNWAMQLERDGFLSEFSTDDHKLVLIIFTDKDGILPWDPNCGSYWPQICPPPFIASAQLEITGNDDMLCMLEKNMSLDRIIEEVKEDTPDFDPSKYKKAIKTLYDATPTQLQNVINKYKKK
tara:strand:+ start:196 stop:906 length:711 start_codon:yes stop_codon:yes gene_type:complete